MTDMMSAHRVHSSKSCEVETAIGLVIVFPTTTYWTVTKRGSPQALNRRGAGQCLVEEDCDGKQLSKRVCVLAKTHRRVEEGQRDPRWRSDTATLNTTTA